jgi:hypothetical protein
MSGLCQVIIKITNVSKGLVAPASINRSQSLLTTNRIPVLAPSRSERVRLESLLADVWTREILPFPGMTGRARSEHLVRASAHSMMRKLNVASITSNFTKRSGSMASLNKTTEDDNSVDNDTQKVTYSRTEHNSSESSALPEVDKAAASRLAASQDEKEILKQNDSIENLSSRMSTSNGSPAETLRRFATLKGRKSWPHDEQRIITPSLRTSSANSVSQSRITLWLTVSDKQCKEKENVPQIQAAQPIQTGQKPGKKGKGILKPRAVTEGLRNLFR